MIEESKQYNKVASMGKNMTSQYSNYGKKIIIKAAAAEEEDDDDDEKEEIRFMYAV